MPSLLASLQRIREILASGGNRTGVSAQSTKVALLGDSITHKASFDGLILTPPFFGYLSDCYWTWCNILLGQRCSWVDHGVDANRLDQMASRIGNVIADAPGWCICMGGVNDVTSGRSLPQMQESVRAISSALTAARIIVLWLPATPVALTYHDSSKRALRLAYNRWLSEWCPANGHLFVDTNVGLADPKTGDPREGTYSDELHPAIPAAFLMGRTLARYLDPLMPGTARSVESIHDPENLMGAAAFFDDGSAGSLGDGVTGVVGDHWLVCWTNRGSGNAVCSLVPRTDDLPGTMQQLVIGGTPDTAAELLTIHDVPVSGATFAVGDTLCAEVEYEIDGGGAFHALYVRCQPMEDTDTGILGSFAGNAFELSALHQTAAVAHRGRLLTPPFVLPSASMQVRVTFGVHTGGASGLTVRLGQVVLRDMLRNELRET